jgi:hypothetical protein
MLSVAEAADALNAYDVDVVVKGPDIGLMRLADLEADLS